MVEILEIKTEKKATLQRLPYQPGDVQKTYADITKSKQILEYDPKTKFEEGLDIFIEWYKLHISK
jgi:UDP-glucuronate 4-epimerase